MKLNTKHNDWLELFAVSDYVPPKFWLGDRVKVYDRFATVMGLEWRPEEAPLVHGGVIRAGWWYRIRWDRSISTQGVYEAMLTRADEENQSY